MSAAEVDTDSIQKMLGHKCETSTQHYINKSFSKKAVKGNFLNIIEREPLDCIVDETAYRTYFRETYSPSHEEKLYDLHADF